MCGRTQADCYNAMPVGPPKSFIWPFHNWILCFQFPLMFASNVLNLHFWNAASNCLVETIRTNLLLGLVISAELQDAAPLFMQQWSLNFGSLYWHWTQLPNTAQQVQPSLVAVCWCVCEPEAVVWNQWAESKTFVDRITSNWIPCT